MLVATASVVLLVDEGGALPVSASSIYVYLFYKVLFEHNPTYWDSLLKEVVAGGFAADTPKAYSRALASFATFLLVRLRGALLVAAITGSGSVMMSDFTCFCLCSSLHFASSY